MLGWAGGAAIVLGAVFFLVMAVSRGWIDEPTRVVLAFLGSTLLFAAGLFLYERHGKTQAALAAVASGIAALYASDTAATQLYDLIAPAVGLTVAAVISAAACAIAVRWSSRVVAGIGIVGALLAPVLVGAGTSGSALAFMAIALVASTAVLLWQQWDWLAFAAFLASAPQLLYWLYETRDDELVRALIVLALFWAIYVVAAIGYELRVPVPTLRASSASLLLGDAVLIAGAGYLVLSDQDHGDAATAWVIALALVHVVLGVAGFRGRMSDQIGALLAAVGIGLSAIGLALALSGPALVVGWSVEAVVLAWVARRTGELRARLGVLLFLLLATGHLLLVEAPPSALLVGVDSLAEAVVGIAVVALAALAVERLSAGLAGAGGRSLCARSPRSRSCICRRSRSWTRGPPETPPIRVRRRSSCSARCGGSRDSARSSSVSYVTSAVCGSRASACLRSPSRRCSSSTSPRSSRSTASPRSSRSACCCSRPRSRTSGCGANRDEGAARRRDGRARSRCGSDRGAGHDDLPLRAHARSRVQPPDPRRARRRDVRA